MSPISLYVGSIGEYNMEDKFKFSESFIQGVLNNFFAFNSVRYNINNLYVFDWESDKLLETKSGYIYEFEIKISRGDFKNDFKNKKDKHIILEGEERYGDQYLPEYYRALESNRNYSERAAERFIEHYKDSPIYLISKHKRPNYFYYAVPDDLISVEEVPDYAGLIYVSQGGGFRIMKKAPCLHKEKYNDAELKLGEKFYFNMIKWKDECTRAYKDKVYWKEKFEKELESNGHKVAYLDLENELEGYKKAYHELSQKIEKSDNANHREFYNKNRLIRLLSRELQKYNQQFDLFTFEKENGLEI